ncbi:hypothetical protein RugamoR64_52310 [Duganella rhizosphaerae]|uniref:DinB family protein n=1 Tax=Duganella rhizosphaerae TaxID=2885763 RepID=UPI0030EA9CE2
MEAALSCATSMFCAADHYMEQSLSGLPTTAQAQRAGGANSILWVVGHALVGRLRLLTLLGADNDIPWQEFFDKGGSEALSASDARRPDLPALMARWNASKDALARRLADLTAEDLAVPQSYDLPTCDPTLLGLISYFAFHEAYHIGQIACIRKAIGQPLPRRTADRALSH